MSFEWDDKKASANLKKHGVSFAEAATAFQDPNALEMFDEDHSEDDEDRWVLVGMSAKSRVLLVIFVEEVEDSLRIISARKAIPEEVDQYYARIKK